MSQRIILDTSVLVAGLRSSLGASFELLTRVGTGEFDVVVSVPLVLEYEDALSRHLSATTFTKKDVDDFIDYFCSVAIRQEIFFLWRPALRDSGDDLVLEVAVAANCEAIVTHNTRDFAAAAQFGVSVFTPGSFLKRLRGSK